MKGGATSVDCKTKESFIFTERRSDQNKTGGEEKGLKAITAIFTRIVWQEGKKLRRVPRCSNQLSRLAKKQDVVSCVCEKMRNTGPLFFFSLFPHLLCGIGVELS